MKKEQVKIFLSYSWSNKEEANKIDNFFKSKGIILLRDIRDINFKDDIKKFMENIKSCDFVISLISDKYLKSVNCMYETLQLIKDENYKNRILPVIYNGEENNSNIYSSRGRLSYIKFWTEEFKNLSNDMEDVSPDDSIEIAKDLKLYKAIKGDIGAFLSELANMKNETFVDLEKNQFKELIDEINNFKVNNYTHDFSKTNDSIIKNINNYVYKDNAKHIEVKGTYNENHFYGENKGDNNKDIDNSIKAKEVDESKEHDKNIFNNLDSLMSENFIKEFLIKLGYDCYHKDDKNVVDIYVCEANNTKNKYLNEKINDKHSSFLDSLNKKLFKFLTLNFFVCDNNQEERCLYPEKNGDKNYKATQEEMKFYDEKGNELGLLIAEVKEKYREYRLTIKKELYL
jgi:hypothetical protein